jgi:predicted nucleotidyltransferase
MISTAISNQDDASVLIPKAVIIGRIMTPNMKKRLANALAELKKMAEVKAVYLFGSRATGRAVPFSDIDLCVVTGPRIRQKRKTDITSLSDDSIDVSLFWDLPVAMRYRIFKEGRLLFQRNEDYTENVIMQTLREYLDFKPVIRRFAQAAGVSYE